MSDGRTGAAQAIANTTTTRASDSASEGDETASRCGLGGATPLAELFASGSAAAVSDLSSRMAELEAAYGRALDRCRASAAESEGGRAKAAERVQGWIDVEGALCFFEIRFEAAVELRGGVWRGEVSCVATIRSVDGRRVFALGESRVSTELVSGREGSKGLRLEGWGEGLALETWRQARGAFARGPAFAPYRASCEAARLAAVTGVGRSSAACRL